MSSEMEAKTHSALHVLKGAVVKVLGENARWTSSTYVNGSHGRLTIKFDRKPLDIEVKAIEEEANKKIIEDVEIKIYEMNRINAERRWGDLIYDLFPVPPEITKLTIVEIRGWNVNACNKPHVERTGEIGRIKIRKTKFRNKRKLLEISFDVL